MVERSDTTGYDREYGSTPEGSQTRVLRPLRGRGEICIRNPRVAKRNPGLMAATPAG